MCKHPECVPEQSPVERQYKDAAGNPVTLDWLVRHEPEWAANQIRRRDALERQEALAPRQLMQDEIGRLQALAKKHEQDAQEQRRRADKAEADLAAAREALAYLLQFHPEGEFGEQLPREHWTPGYCRAVDAAQAVLAAKEAR